jgi:hypothetical protein
MKLLEGVRSYLTNYPYRRRLPLVGVYLILRAFHRAPYPLHGSYGFVTDVTLILVMLSSPKGRPFWLFVGIFLGQIIGMFMMASLSAFAPR